ncbi:MAG: hypothetical protein QNI99_09990 [Woeseiaceae bacterium]|nr:hypothetical protein [Woeseiaceae bacterium]
MARSVPELSAARDARRELRYELISGLSGLGLALFMWGHMLLVGSILTGAKGFDWLAGFLEDYFIAQPTVVVITALFVIHAVTAARKIPAKLEERRRMQSVAKALKTSRPAGLPDVDRTFHPHVDSMLWIWQVRTGLVLLVLGSFHILLLTVDVLTPIYGDIVGIEAATSMERVAGGLWLPYAILLLCVEFHASVGLYRLAIKWGIGSSLSRKTLKRIEQVILVAFLGFGAVVLAVLAGWLEPPLAFLLEGG